MIILSLKTNEPESEFALFKDSKELQTTKYLAHRDLGVTIHTKIYDMLKKQKLDWNNIEGIACFEGPGSFTGLRIGLTVANTLADSLNIPIIGCQGDDWKKEAIKKLLDGENNKKVMPFYGAEPHITTPKK